MTAHPKYISYLGLIAPQDKKATYLGFGFLYGVFGSFIGSFMGARLYDSIVSSPIITYLKTETARHGHTIAENINLNEALAIAEQLGVNRVEALSHGNPSGLWLIFAGFGIFAVFCISIYAKFIAKKQDVSPTN